MDTSTFLPSSMPTQKIPFSQKDSAWRERCVDAVINIAFTYGESRRSSAKNKKRNYDLFNNKIDLRDFDHVLNPLKLSGDKLASFNFPASVQPYDIISQYFQLLLGEESKRIFNPIAVAVNEEAVNEKNEVRKQQLTELITSMIVDPKDFHAQELAKFQNYSPDMARERGANHILKYYQKKEDLPKVFNDCFKDALVAGEEIVRVDKIADKLEVIRVNPMEVYFVLNSNSDMIDDAEKIYERNYKTISEVVDEFYEILTPDQIQELESIQKGEIPVSIYGPPSLTIPEVDSISAFENNYTNRGIAVHRVRWKSKKKQGVFHYYDEQDQEQEIIVEESFKMPKNDKRNWIEWFWINEYWEGIKLGSDMYIEKTIKPRNQQFRSMDNLSECKSGYIGSVYSCTNSTSVSLMDRLVPWIYMYLITWYRTELALAKYQGNIVTLDISLMPSGWDPEKWMYYAQAMGFTFVNSYNEENRALGMGGGFNQSAQNKVLPLGDAQYITQHIGLLQHIDERIQNTAGISRQRLGSISTSELVGNTERAVTQSSHVTEPYFFLHENFKLRVCDAILEVAKDCIGNKSKSIQYVTDSLLSVVYSVDGYEYSNADYGTFCSNTSKDMETLMQMKNLLQAALQNDKIQLSDAASVLSSNSVSDIKAALIKSEQDAIQRQQQAEEQQNALQQQQIQAGQEATDKQIALEKERMDREDINKQLDRENKLQVEELRGLGFAKDTDVDDDGVPDILEQGKLNLEQSKHAADVAFNHRKLKLEEDKVKAENIRSKSDQDISKQQLEQKKEELKVKERIEKYKVNHKPKPKAKK